MTASEPAIRDPAVFEPVVLNIRPVGLSDAQFYALCRANDRWRIEETAQGELIVMPPVGGVSGNREAEFGADLAIWNRRTELGKVFSSSTIFILPAGGKRSPDAAWVANDRWAALSPEDREKFPPLCPDFVIELRSRTDALAPLQAKMQEYLASGLQLGWLVDPQRQLVEIYRRDRPVESSALPATLSGETVLPGFELAIARF